MKKLILINGNEQSVEIEKRGADFVEFNLADKTYRFNVFGGDANHVVLKCGQNNYKITYAHSSKNSEQGFFSLKGQEILIETPSKGRLKKKGDDHGHMVSPMPGKVIKVLKSIGEKVQVGDALLILEAMKMEHTIRANCNGVVEKIFYNEGDLVDGQVELILIEEDKE